MSIPASLLPTTCDVYRPLGAGSPLATDVPCRLVPDLTRGNAGQLLWTHYLDLDEAADIIDGCSRTFGANVIVYADGDEVRIPAGSSQKYVVVWVETRQLGTAQAFKRAYLMRDTT